MHSTTMWDCRSSGPTHVACAEQPEIARAIHKVLEERGVSLPACHFRTPDVELVRYAITVGLLTAKTPEDRYVAMADRSVNCHFCQQSLPMQVSSFGLAGLQACSSTCAGSCAE